MNRKPFYFKQFHIHHDQCAMKVGTDGVLLGAWAPLNNAKNILDIGTGTGLIAIMLAQRSMHQVTIDAIEINKAAYNQAIENVDNCTWKDQINVVNTSLQEFYNSQQLKKYDLIVSNPPFFIQSSKPTVANRSIARHTDSLTHEEILISCEHLLDANGVLSIILPFVEGDQFITLAKQNGLFCNNRVEVRPKINKSVERLLLTFSKVESTNLSSSQLVIQHEKRNDYTSKYIELTRDFYTIM